MGQLGRQASPDRLLDLVCLPAACHRDGVCACAAPFYFRLLTCCHSSPSPFPPRFCFECFSCCANCMHILPRLHAFEEAHPELLAVVGVHSPKFEGESVGTNVRSTRSGFDLSAWSVQPRATRLDSTGRCTHTHPSPPPVVVRRGAAGSDDAPGGQRHRAGAVEGTQRQGKNAPC